MDLLNDKTAELVVMVLILFNVVATAGVSVLEVIKKPLSSSHWLHKVISLVQKAVDAVTANKKH
jgi:uncharacterized protein YpmB